MQQQLAPAGLASIQRPVRAELDACFSELGRIVTSDFELIRDVNRHLLRIKGKLFRPSLLLLSRKSVGEVEPRHVSLAAVTELIHLATLVHDDSVDHSVLRRGQPTVNSAFSHEVAVIMGDFLYSRAITELVTLGDLEALRVISRVTNELTVGEMREIQAYDHLDYSVEEYERLIKAKTASLMSGACEVAALGDADRYRPFLRDYGHFLGMAFQVTDDVLDFTGDESVTGKPSGHDLKEHKITLPLILALGSMSEGERGLVQQLMRDPEPSEQLTTTVIAVVAERGGIESAQDRASDFAELAVSQLEQLPESATREALRDCVSYAIERRS